MEIDFAMSNYFMTKYMLRIMQKRKHNVGFSKNVCFLSNGLFCCDKTLHSEALCTR